MVPIFGSFGVLFVCLGLFVCFWGGFFRRGWDFGILFVWVCLFGFLWIFCGGVGFLGDLCLFSGGVF